MDCFYETEAVVLLHGSVLAKWAFSCIRVKGVMALTKRPIKRKRQIINKKKNE
jgi:hypothetical protein